MSQFPSMPPPGAYAPPNHSPQPQGYSQQQQPHHAYQQQPAPSPYGASAPGYNPAVSQKPTKALGQVFNQAVTQGKPMLDKLGKSISSKLGNKHSKPSTPQHLQSYQNYQEHQQYGQAQVQQPQQNQAQSYPNQGQPQAARPQSVYQTPQQSPFESTYATPASGNSGQNNYFPQQVPPPPQQQAFHYHQPPPAPQQPPYQQNSHSSFDTNLPTQGHSHSQSPVQPEQGQFSQSQPQRLPQQTSYGQASGQQTGVISSTQPQVQNNFQQTPQPGNNVPPQSQHPQQQHPQQHPQQHHQQQQQQQQQQQWVAPAPSPQQHAPVAPQTPINTNPTPPPHQHGSTPSVPMPHNQQQLHQPPPLQHPQWTSMPSVSPQAQQAQLSSPANSPPPQSPRMEHPASPGTGSQEQQSKQQVQSEAEQPQQQTAQQATSAVQSGPPKSGPMEFIAELPADMSSLSVLEGVKTEQATSTGSQAAPYRAYRPASGQNVSPGPGYTIARRAVSTSSLPLADPWRLADAKTELPTREFYILADVLFDSIDRKFEPQNTGLLEASKVLESWKTQQLPAEAAELFAHDSYGAFGKMWSLQGVPHILVPCQPELMPTWNFQQQVHSQDLKVQEETALATASYPSYMPALNRAGWYKYCFLNWLHQAEDLEKMLSAFCADSYNPGIFNQPDLQKRDKNESPSLVSRATAISTTAVSRVCQEVVARMQGNSQDRAKQGGGAQGQGLHAAQQAQYNGEVTDPEAALKVHSLQIQQQLSHMMNRPTT